MTIRPAFSDIRIILYASQRTALWKTDKVWTTWLSRRGKVGRDSKKVLPLLGAMSERMRSEVC